MNTSAPDYKQELANVITHGLGILLGLIAFPVLFFQVSEQSVWVGIITFAFGFLFMYTASTSYHLAHKPMVKLWLRRIDHISIYFLIAGTYTPFLLLYLDNPKGTLLLWILWGITAAGTIFKLFLAGKFRVLSTLLYLAMGWLAVVAISDLLKTMPRDILWLIGAGGAFYSIGTLFYLRKSWTWHHPVWHVFVLGGSICHLWAVWLAVV
jgi:hemolysin III